MRMSASGFGRAEPRYPLVVQPTAQYGETECAEGDHGGDPRRMGKAEMSDDQRTRPGSAGHAKVEGGDVESCGDIDCLRCALTSRTTCFVDHVINALGKVPFDV